MQTQVRTACWLCFAAMSLTGSFAEPAPDVKAKPLCSLLTREDAQRIKGVPVVADKVGTSTEECVYFPAAGAPLDMVGISVERGSWTIEKQVWTSMAKTGKATIENLPGIRDDAFLYSKENGGVTFLEFHKGQAIFKLQANLPDGKLEPLKQVAKKIADSSAISNIVQNFLRDH